MKEQRGGRAIAEAEDRAGEAVRAAAERAEERMETRKKYGMHATMFMYLQGQLDLAFPLDDPEWYFARGTEYRFASRMVEACFYAGSLTKKEGCSHDAQEQSTRARRGFVG